MGRGQGRFVTFVGVFIVATCTSTVVLTLIQRTALFNAERNSVWRCMRASSLEDGAKVLEKRAIRTLGVEGVRGVRGLARARESVARLLQLQAVGA